MFTNNYIEYRKMMFFGNNQSGNVFVSPTGTTHGATAQHSYNGDIGFYMKSAYCAEPGWGVYFGSGSTPAARTDYKLESAITSGLTITNPSEVALTAEGAGKYIAQSAFTVHNDSSEDITIREIGCYGKTSASSTASQNKNTLFDRTVLDEPVTIPAGQGKVIVYKLVFNQS